MKPTDYANRPAGYISTARLRLHCISCKRAVVQMIKLSVHSAHCYSEKHKVNFE